MTKRIAFLAHFARFLSDTRRGILHTAYSVSQEERTNCAQKYASSAPTEITKIYGHKERGLVSILSVIFFIILMSILTVSFMRIVTDEQTQVEDDDLSRGALTSAQSGVEDAKRALLYCRSRSSADPVCDTLANTSCPGVFADNDLVTALGINVQGDRSVQVGGTDANQRYTCVTIVRNGTTYANTATEENVQLVPLRATGTFNEVRFSWSEPRGAGTPAIPAAAVSEVPRRAAWDSNGAVAGGTAYLPVPRLQFFDFQTSQSLTAMQNNTVGMYLFPARAGGRTVIPNAAGSLAITKGSVGNGHVTANCPNPPALTAQGFRCTMTVRVNAPGAASTYFLAVKAVYGQTRYQVELLNNGVAVPFDDVQPIVDSTGVAGDVYKRIRSRVDYVLDPFFTTNAVEAGRGVCKEFYVTADAATEGPEDCLDF